MNLEKPQQIPQRRKEDQEKRPSVDLNEQPYLPFPELQDTQIETYIHEHSAEVGFNGARERVIEILKIVKEDEQAIKIINETLQSIFHYVESIYKMEVMTKLLSERWEGKETAEKLERHDARRRRAHDALITNLIATTRYLNTHFSGEVPPTGIYNGNSSELTSQDRVAIADWAIELEHEILLERVR